MYIVRYECLTPEKLAFIERGNPARSFKFKTLSDAIATINLLRMACGFAMLRGPRRMLKGECMVLGAGDHSITLRRETGV